MFQQSSVAQVVYKGVPGFPGYRVGDDGSVWSCLRQIHRLGRSGFQTIVSDSWRKLDLSIDPVGRPRVNLCSDSGRRMTMVCRLVLAIFVGDCPKGLQCCHNDGNPANNRVDNLRWDTPKANQADRKKHGTAMMGEQSPTAKLTEDEVKQMRIEHASGSHNYRELGRKYRTSFTNARAIVLRKTWAHVA